MLITIGLILGGLSYAAGALATGISIYDDPFETSRLKQVGVTAFWPVTVPYIIAREALS